MGLLLSVLVACVGVVELLAFYSNVTRNFVTTSTQTTLADLNKKYLDELGKRKEGTFLTKTDTNHLSVCNNSVKFKEKILCSTNATTSENIELEFSNNHNGSKSRSPSPRRFLLTEKDTPNRSKSPSPRHFLVSDEVADDDTTKDLRKFVVEQKNSQHEETQFFIKDTNSKETTFPLPKQFIVTEQEVEIAENSKPLDRSRSPSPPIKRFEEQEVVFRRSPSPYPSLVLSVPRNSICSELLDNPSLSVVEVDEEALSKSPTPEKIDRISERIEHKTNQVLEVPQRERHSCSSESKNSFVNKHSSEEKREPEPNGVLKNSTETNDINDDVKEYDEQFLDSLDGVKKKKISRSSSTRKSRKKKISTDSPSVSDETNKDDFLSSSSKQNNDAEIAKTLTEAANVLKNVNQEMDDGLAKPGTSKDGGSNATEPFWVNP